MHTNVCEPIECDTYDGYKHFVASLDEYSHYSFAYLDLLKAKSEVRDRFKDFEAKVTAKFTSKISKPNSDLDKEYISGVLVGFCREERIELQSTAPYCPEQNGHLVVSFAFFLENQKLARFI